MNCLVKAFLDTELLNFVSYDMEAFKKKKKNLWISPQDLFELLTAVMKVIPEVFSTSLVTDDFVWMLYWICYKQMMYDWNKWFL